MLYVRGVLYLALCLCVFSVEARAAGQEAARQLAGEIVSVAGTAFVRADGRQSKKEPVPAKAGDKVYSGDVINTGSTGQIKVLMQDKSVVDLGPSALFKIDQFTPNSGLDRQVDVTMAYGTLRGVVTKKIEGKGRFRVRTPAATMGVRGTEFVIKSEGGTFEQLRNSFKGGKFPQANAGKTEITVLQGRVDVNQSLNKSLTSGTGGNLSPTVSLNAGSQLTTSTGEIAPPKMVVLNANQLSVIGNAARVTDNTFSRATLIDTSNVGGDQQRGPASNGPLGGDHLGPSPSDASNAVASALTSVPVVNANIPTIDIANLGTVGAPSVGDVFNQIPNNIPTGNKTLRVKIIRGTAATATTTTTTTTTGLGGL